MKTLCEGVGQLFPIRVKKEGVFGEMKKSILQIGPSPTRSKGGMATVIREILEDPELNQKFDIDFFESYVDGNRAKVLLYSAWALIRFVCTGKAQKYDIYHIHVASNGSTFRKIMYQRLIKRYGKKVIFHIHGGGYMCFFEGASSKQKNRITRALKSADMVIALSDEWKQKFDETFELRNCDVLENGINLEKYSPAVGNSSQFSKSFLALGRMGTPKGTYDLVRAIEIAQHKVPDIMCYLAGDGEVEKFRDLVRERSLQGNIEVVGWADFDKKLELLSKTATVVLPSYNEGLPMAILEGMACGKAVISTKVGAIPEVVTSENGILIEPGDVEALADALVKCCTDPNMLCTMARNNICKTEQMFSMKKMHTTLAGYYQALG